MCKEDVTIGRKMVVSATSYAVPGAGPVLALKPRPTRIALILSTTAAAFALGNESVYLSSGGPAPVTPWLVLNTYRLTGRADVRDFGQLVTGPIYITDDSTGGLPIFITELYLTESLEDV